MYGYRTKHNIIETYFNWVNKNFPDDITKPMPIKELCKLISGKEINNTIAAHIYNMKLDGYFEWVDIKTDNQKIIATDKAIGAGTSDYFKRKQHELFWKAFMNIAITMANIAVAIVAVWTLSKGNDEVQKLEERLMLLERGQDIILGIANPNSQQTQCFGQPKAKDASSKLTSDTTNK